MDYSNLTDADIRNMSDDELDAAISASDQASDAATSSATASALTDEDIASMSDDELDAAIAGTRVRPASQDSAMPVPSVSPHYDPQNIGKARTPVTANDAKRMPKMGGAELASLQVQAEGGPMAETADGSVSNWLGNFWNAVAYNSSGKLTAKNTAMNNQDILRGAVRKDGKEVPLTKLDDSELDYLVDAAGWNGPGAYFRRFLGKWARSDEGVMQDWDRTQGAKIADPVARKQARVRYAQDIARMNVEQQEGEKLAAQTEIDNRPRQTGAGIVSGGITQGAYMLPYMIPGTHGIVAGAIEGLDRSQELLSDRYAVDQEGNIGVAAERDSTGTAITKGAARGVIAPLIEFAGGKVIDNQYVKGLAAGMLGKIPLVRNAAGKLAETAVGKAVNGYVRSMSRLGKVTGLQSFPIEAIEELEDQVVDSALGLNTRSSETQGNVLTRAGDSAAQFMKPDSLMDLAESMLLVQIFGGGVAALNDRTRSKAIDNILARDLGVSADKLKGYSADEKWAAYEEYTKQLTPEEVEKKFDAGRRAIDELTNVMGESDAELRDFEEAAGATRTGGVIDDRAVRETSAAAAKATSDIANAAEGERRAEGMLNPEQAEAQQRELNNAEEAKKIPALADRVYNAKLNNIAKGETDGEVESPSSVRGGLDPVAEQFRVASEAVDGNRDEYDKWLADAGREDSPQARVDWFARVSNDAASKEEQTRVQTVAQGEEAEMPEPISAPQTSGNAPTGAPKAEGALTPASEAKPAEADSRASSVAPATENAETKTPVDTTTEKNYTNTERTTEDGQPEQQTQLEDASARDAGNGGRTADVAPEDEFDRLLAGSRQMAADERRAFADGSKALDESDLGSPVGGRSENRKGRVVDVLRRRIASGNRGAGLDSVTEAKIPFSDKHGEETFRIGQTDAKTFHDVFEYVRHHLKNGELVDLHDVKDYEDADCYLSEDGLSGFAVSPDGNLISVFSLRRGSLGAMKDAIIAAGANHLDAFASKNQNLRAIYEWTLGFKPVADMEFNPDYDQSGIGAKHGNPDVTFMALPKKGQEFVQKRFGKDDYDAAVAHLNFEMKKPPKLVRPDASPDVFSPSQQNKYEAWLLDQALDAAIKDKLPNDAAVVPLADTPENRNAFMRAEAEEAAEAQKVSEALAAQRTALEKRGEKKEFIDWLEQHRLVIGASEAKDGHPAYTKKQNLDFARKQFRGAQVKPDKKGGGKESGEKPNALRTANGMNARLLREYRDWLATAGEEDENGMVTSLQDTPENRERFLAERRDASAEKKLDVEKLRKEGAQTVVTPEEAKDLPQTVDEIVDLAARVFGVSSEFDKSQPGNAEYREDIRRAVSSLPKDKQLQYAKLLKAQAAEGKGYSKQAADAERRIGWEEANGMSVGRMANASEKGTGVGSSVLSEASRMSSAEERIVEAQARKEETEALKAEAEAEKAKAEAEAAKVGADAAVDAANANAEPAASDVASGNRRRISPDPVRNDELAKFMPEASRGKATFREEQRPVKVDGLDTYQGGSYAVYVDGKNTGVFVGNDGKFFLPGRNEYFESFDKAQAFLNREATSFKTGQRVSFKADDGTVVSGQAIVRPDGSLAIRTKQKDPRNPFANVVKDVEVPKDKMPSVTKIGVRESRVEASDDVPETWDAKVKAEVQKAAERVKGWLKGVTVKFADGPSEGSAESRDLRDGNGNVVGSYDRETNEVVLYPGATVGTVAHEIGWHATYKFAEDEAKAGRPQLKQTLDGYIDNAPKVVKDAVKAAYGDLSEDALRDEIGAHIFERKHGAELEKALRTMEGRAWYNRVWDAIKRVAGKMLKAFGVDVSKVDLAKLERMKPEDGMAWLAKQFASGKTLGTVDAAEGGTIEGGADSEAIRYARSPLPPGSNPMDEKRTKGSKLREKWQDSDIEIRNVQDEIGGVQDAVDANGHTDARTSADVYAAKMRANGYVEQGIRDIQRRRDELSKVLADNGITPKMLDKFLVAMHAPERNRTTSARDGRAYDPTDKFGSGMSEVDANAYLSSPEVAAKRTAFDEAAKIVWDMNKADLKRRLDSGRISQDQYDFLARQWKYYVPLRTDAENGSLNAFNMSTAGFRSSEFSTAKGRMTEADSPTAFSFLQAQQGVNGSERNVVNTTLANLVRHAEAEGKRIGEVVEGRMQPRGIGWTFEFADGERVVADGASKLAANHDNIVLFKEDGVLKAIRIDPGKEGRGNDFAKAVRGDNIGKWGEGLQWIPRMTRFMSEMRTQYSPTFSIRNVLADHLESQQAFVGRFGLRDGLALAKDAIKAEVSENRNLRAYLRDGTLTGRVKEFVEGGGLIKGGVAAMGFSGEQNEIKDTYAKYVRKAKGFVGMTNSERAKALWDGTFELIKGANEILENSTRLGIFSALRDRGVPIPEAVKFAREATVDFNRKGTAMPYFNGLYMFANAAMQGTVRAGKSFVDDWSAKPTSGLGSNRKMRGELTATLVALGVAKAVVDHFIGDDDDRDKAGGRNARNLSEYDKKHLLGVPVGGGNQLVLLRTRGPYAAIPYVAQTLANVALGETDWQDAAKNIASEVGSQAVDIAGGNGIGSKSEALQTIMPSVGDPFVQWATGTDYKGEDRVKRTFDKNQPASHNGRDSTSAAFKAAAKSINFLTGGNENRKGFLDWAPEDIQLAWDTVFGGVGRDISNLAEGGENAYRRFVKGEEPERGFSAYPFLKDIVREYPENTQRFYDAFGKYEADKSEFRKTTDMKRRAELKREHPYLSQGKGRIDNLKDRIDELRHWEKNEVKSGNKWVARKQPISDERRNKFHSRRLRLQASVLKMLGE